MAKGGKREGAGRKAGTPNKLTTEVKEMILAALDRAGGIEYLTTQAHENPNAFLSLIGKVLPLQVKADVKGNVEIAVIRFSDVADPPSE